MPRRAQIMIVQHLDHLAGGHPAAGAFGGHALQLCPQGLELGDLLADIHEMPLSSRQERTDIRVDMERALETLPRGARQVFVLHDVEGFTHEEIADMLEVTAGTSKSQLHRARMALRQHLA